MKIDERYFEFSPKAKQWLKHLKDRVSLERVAVNIEIITADPCAGDEKCEDSKGVCGKSFNWSGVACRIAYSLNPEKQLASITMIGLWENFYDELKRYIR
ncbi:MAG: type II toxin-antitoxin system RelE/ParE family toxin [Bacillota bacterium]